MKLQTTMGGSWGGNCGGLMWGLQRQQVRVLLGDKVRPGARKQKAEPVVLAPVGPGSSSSSSELWTRFTRPSSPRRVGSHGRQRCPPPGRCPSMHWHRGNKSGEGRCTSAAAASFYHLKPPFKVFWASENHPQKKAKSVFFFFFWAAVRNVNELRRDSCERTRREAGLCFSPSQCSEM